MMSSDYGRAVLSGTPGGRRTPNALWTSAGHTSAERSSRGANLIGADLSIANLKEANLIEADLYGANLIGANLRGAYLNRAYLGGAFLGETEFVNVNLTAAKLDQCLHMGPSIIDHRTLQRSGRLP
jgi:uncharacterized protein YjbI with pentapeptide repeats